ncbi:TraR/DksA family transcriptional regulator [Knoellia aerolata]|uniref:Zinc finger DksA/TraR C4-type domain-containing protein n=1 Tax=Knoellia aerolata DSM 18566 TaxID=1385519 RepID=A0A0A0JU52_9MICO|nr:TraR/DksA C4-type zinc finger protein [Knoellia aerolata]KGN40239.1 hypothetical protein N801_15315 [Knoellia aerolata DSM 18566]
MAAKGAPSGTSTTGPGKASSALAVVKKALGRASKPASANNTKVPAAKAAAAKKAPATKAAAAKKAPTAKAAAAKKAPAAKAPATTATPAATRASAAAARKAKLVVREDESPWTAAELKAVRAEIEADVAQLRSEVSHAESELSELLRNSGDGAGDDQADAGAKTWEREQEIALADNAREMLRQNEHALERLDDGTYGVCESCGQPIGKLRLQAAPRATLCMPCKMKQERR